MLYLFFGDDTKKKYEALEKFSQSFPAEIETFSFTRNNFDQSQVENFYSGTGLFFGRPAAIFDNVLEKEGARDFFLSRLELLAKSENLFIFLEGQLDKSTLDAFKKARAELNSFELPKAQKEKFNNFLLANAFGNKNKLYLWIYFRQAVNRGVGMEELAGVLFWKAKDMLFRNNFSKFSKTELQLFSSRISYLLPQARQEGQDAEMAFEEFLLEAF